MEIAKILNNNPKKLINAFILPTILAQIIFAFSRTLEKIFVGQVLGNVAIASISITFPLFTIIIAFSMWIRIGSGTSISIAIGNKNTDYAEKVLGTSIVLLIITALLIMFVTSIFLEDILLKIGANQQILPMSIQYMNMTIYGLIINFLAFGVSHLIRAEGNPLSGMWTLVAGAILNIILSFLFIKKLNLGIFGSALAPVLGNTLSVIFIFWHFLKNKKRNLSIRRKYLKLDVTIIKKIIPIGFSSFILMAGGSLVAMLTNSLLIKQGNVTYVGIMGSFTYSLLFIQIIITGFCYGFQPLFGFSYGQKNKKRLKTYLKYALILGTGFSILSFIILFGFPSKTAMLFSKNNPKIVETTLELMKLFFCCLPFVGFNMLGIYFFQSIGKVKQANFIFSLQKGLLLIGVLVFPHFYEIQGFFISFPFSEFVLAIVLSILLIKEFKK